MTSLLSLVRSAKAAEAARPTRSVDFVARSDGAHRFECDFKAACEQDAGRLTAVAQRYLRNAADAEDAVQDALLSAYRKRDTFEGTSSLGTWLHRILVNVCLMKLRSKSRRPAASIEELPAGMMENVQRVQASDDETAERDVLREEARHLVRDALRNLPETHRTIIQLRDFEEFTTGQTAEILGISEDAVKTRLCRARRALRELLE
jgi:RNA polymerase sigma-70 factor (ECF subfamily)